MTKKKTTKPRTSKKIAKPKTKNPSKAKPNPKKAKPKTKKKTKPSKAPTRSAWPSVLVLLGQFRKLILTDGHEFSARKVDGYSLASNVSGNKLFIFKLDGDRSVSRKAVYDKTIARETIDKAVSLREVFTDYKAEHLTIGSVGTKALKTAGRVAELYYASNKWSGKTAVYVHEFDKAPVAKMDGKTFPSLVTISGGNIRVTKKGIEG